MRKLLTVILLFLLMACQAESGPYPKQIELLTPSGDVIKTTLVVTMQEQEQGLSGTKSEDFNENQGMLFFYQEDSDKYFWMPDTYFDLDIIFTDKELKILDIIRKLPHYIGRNNPDLIPKARPVFARHALEMKASSKISAALKVGDTLKLKSDLTLEQLNEKIKSALKAAKK